MAIAADRALTPEQESAVARRGEPLLVSAGAGSGKTTVLVERFVRTVCEDGVAPARILAITFTDRAAGELRERVRARLLQMSEREAARDTEAAFVCTFHGFCTRVLRSHALLAGLDPHFRILDEGVAAGVRERAFALALADLQSSEGDAAVELVAAYGPDRLQAMLWRTYAELRARGMSSPRLPALAAAVTSTASGAGQGREPDARAQVTADGDAVLACALLGELLERFGERYEALKRARGAVDFDDLELRALELLEGQPHVRQAWSERFAAVMVDEFQDTNPRQLRILQALERANLFTVGDEQQSIYGFRDADVRLFRRRREELQARGASLQLTGNFRSRPELLEVVNAVFHARLGAGYMRLTATREPRGSNGSAEPAVELLLTSKNGWNGNGQQGEPPPAGGEGATTARWRQAEAQALSARVHELVSSGEVRAGDVVVLLRALGDIEAYERALAGRGLKTLATAGGFWRRQEIGDLLTYLRALANPLDELALFGTLAGPLAGLSSDSLALIARAAHDRAEPAWTALCGEGREDLRARLGDFDGERLVAFSEALQRERRGMPRHSVSRLLEAALTDGRYEQHLRGSDGWERRLANVHKLLRLARSFEEAEGRGLRAFLDHVGLLQRSPSGPEADAPVAGAQPEAVRLMSVHAAKGLEFPVVCIADLGRSQNLAVSDLLVEGDRVGLRLARLDGAEATPALAYEELCGQRKRAQAEEEERILYVAMTRARDRLLLSGAVSFERWPESRLGAPAISWLGPALIEGLGELLRSGADSPAPRVLDLSLQRASGVRVRCQLNAPASPVTAAPQAAQPEVPPAQATPAPQGNQDDVAAARVAAAPQRPPGADEMAERSAFADGAPLSYTALSEHRRCGYRFYLERVLGLEEDRAATRDRSGGGLDARARGAIVHKLLESVDFRRPAAPSAAQAAAAARELGLRAARRECEQLASLAGAATGGRAPVGARLAAAEELHREHPFAFALGPAQPLFTGVIDVLARERDGTWLVVDYKSDHVGAELALAEVVEREYDLQRLIYALAALRAGARSVEIVHWFLQRPEDPVSVRFQAADQAALQARLEAHLQAASARGFAVSEHPHRGLCETCPGRRALCSWSDAETLREQPATALSEEPR